MGSQGPSSKHSPTETLGVFADAEPAGAPLTASEVAAELGCARRTAYNKLESLAAEGALETKKVGARARVWWRPVVGDRSPAEHRDGERGENEREDAIEEGEEPSLESAQFRELVEAVKDYAIFVLDADGRVRTWNEGARQLKGYEEEEIRGEHFSAFYTDEDQNAGRPAANLRAATEEGRTVDEGWRVRKDGSTFWANVTITALRDDDGDLQGFVKITRDMTERHEYEERIREQKERFEALVREVKDYAIFMLDADGRVRTWNEGARQLKGYEEEEIRGEHFSAFYTDEDQNAGRPAANLRAATEEGRTVDEGWRVRKDGSTFWANVTITALRDDDGDLQGFVKITRDMTERHEYEERIRRQRDELDDLNQINSVIRDIDQALVTATSRSEIEHAVCDRLASSDIYAGAWTAEYADDFGEFEPRVTAGVDADSLDALRAAGGEVAESAFATALEKRRVLTLDAPRVEPDAGAGADRPRSQAFESASVVPLAYEGVEYGVLVVYGTREGAFDQRKRDVLGELGETISHAIESVRRKERERTLTALQRSTRELLHTETPGEIGDIIVETLTGELGLADARVFHFDTVENVLEAVSSSVRAGASPSRFAPDAHGGDSTVWTSFVEGETRVTDADVAASGDVGRQTMVVPLGDHGVLAVASPAGETFDTTTSNLVELVGATAEAAFDRVENQANLRERDELLQTQNQRLQRLNGINTIIREVDQGLVQATTRDEIQRVVCERLTRSDHFRFAWIGTVTDAEGGLTPVAESGSGRGYLDSVSLAAADEAEEAEPATEAADAAEAAVVSNVAANLRAGGWRREAFSREFQSVISVPLRYGDVTYGVLSVYADQPDVFEEMEQSVFEELGETVANAINAVETKRALLSDQGVEVDLTLDDPSASVLGQLAQRLDATVAFEGAVPSSAERVHLFASVAGASESAIEDALGEIAAVESGQVLASGDEESLVELEVVGSSVGFSLVEYGASPRALTATPTEVRVTAELPGTTTVREFVEWFQSQYEGARFVARRERERSTRTRGGLYAALEEALTDRQLEVLKTAYYSGFFTTPRTSTGSDVAALLDVSQPTVSEQLRVAQRKVLELLFANEPADVDV